MVGISPLRTVAADSGVSMTIYTLVSSAKRRIEAPMSLTMSFLNVKNSRGPRINPCGTPGGNGASFRALAINYDTLSTTW